MTTQDSDLRADLFSAQEWCADLVENTSEEQLDLPTPCTDFTVAQIIAHIGMVFEKIVAFGSDHGDPWFGQDLSPSEYTRLSQEFLSTFVKGQTPQERATRLRALIERARREWSDDTLEAEIQLGWGPRLPGRDVLSIYLMETLAHGWDLASATGQNAEAPEVVARAGLEAAKHGLPEVPRGMEHGVPFGTVVSSRPQAGLTEQLANWTGRRWPISNS